jgi:site-specific recombinase XerD
MLNLDAANDPMPAKGKPLHGKTPVARAAEQGWREEDQMSLQRSISPDAPEAKPVKGRKSQHSTGAGGGPPILKAIRKESGMGLKVLARVQKLWPGDPLRQVSEFFADFVIPAATGRKRTVGIKTEEIYVVQMRVMVRHLSDLNMPIQNLGEFSPRHVAALTRFYEAEGLSASSLQKKNTVLRRFGTWMGKPDMAPRLKDLVTDPGRAMRSYSAVESKAWSANGVDPEVVFTRMDLECSVAGLQLRLQHAYGLRPREVVMLKALTADQGKNLFVTDGTKGGRARMVPIDTPRKRELLERAKEIARGNTRGVLSVKPSQSLRAALKRYYYLAERVGLTKSKLGVTLHGLRHEFAGDLFKQITGVDAPVNGGRIDNPELVGRAMQVTSEQLGHGRKDAGAAYLGSQRHIDYAQRKNLGWLIDRLENSKDVLSAVRACGRSSWWVIGSAATGKQLRGTWVLAYRAEAGVVQGADQAQADMAIGAQALAVAAAASRAVGQVATLVPESLVPEGSYVDCERLELIGLWRASFA